MDVKAIRSEPPLCGVQFFSVPSQVSEAWWVELINIKLCVQATGIEITEAIVVYSQHCVLAVTTCFSLRFSTRSIFATICYHGFICGSSVRVWFLCWCWWGFLCTGPCPLGSLSRGCTFFCPCGFENCSKWLVWSPCLSFLSAYNQTTALYWRLYNYCKDYNFEIGWPSQAICSHAVHGYHVRYLRHYSLLLGWEFGLVSTGVTLTLIEAATLWE